MAKRIVMGYWDCPYCGSTGIEGTTYDCPNCGHQRGKEEHVYLSKTKVPYVPGKKIDGVKYVNNHEFKGVDWYCPNCDSMNSASLTECENCGAPRTSESKNAFDFQKDVKKTNLPDPTRFMWECPNCKTLNDEKRSNCRSCGSAKDGSKEEKEAETLKPSSKISKEAEDFTFSSNTQPVKEKIAEEKTENSRDKEKRNFSFNFDWITNIFKNGNFQAILVMIAIVLVGFFAVKGLIYLFTPHPQTLNVTDTYWKYTVDIESYETVNESDWQVPTGGRVQYTKNEIHHYEKVIDHYETVQKSRTVPDGGHYEYETKTRTVPDGGHYEYDYSYNGDGTYTEDSTWVQDYTTETYQEQTYVQDYKTEYYTEQEPVYRDEPIYKTKYYYEIEKWIHKRFVTTEGHDKNVYWGDLNLASNEREGVRSEVYTITAINSKDKKKKEKVYDVNSKDMWMEIEKDTTIKVFTKFSTITSFDNNRNEA